MSKKAAAALRVATSLETYRDLTKRVFDTDEEVIAEFIRDMWSFCDSRDIDLDGLMHASHIEREQDLVKKGLL